MAEETQDGQKTLVAFVVGLLIGGMLVWAFSGPTADAPNTKIGEEDAMENDSNDAVDSTDNDSVSGDAITEIEVPTLQVGDGEIAVKDQAASQSIRLDSATYPISEGWIGVREFNNDQLGYILGVVRFSESNNVVPKEIILQRPTIAGNKYAVVIFTEDGNGEFNSAGDVQVDKIFKTFTAQ